jgi:eukaryotic-like serine/threonine-protein kinase
VPPVSAVRISLPERYRLLRHLANGGMASVWEAHDELLDRDVAVKVLAQHLNEDERARLRFQREARAVAGLSSHPYVVTIYDVGEHDGRSFIVMELLRGGSVADRLRADDPIPRALALRWLHEAASALDAAHEAGIVHRDVKPANMLLDERGRLALADFGIARLAWEDQVTLTGQVLGTAAYISPEQAIGDPASPASDRYSLGVVAYELLTGERPFRAEHFAAQARAHVEDDPPLPSERSDDLPEAVDDVLWRALAKHPDDRWSTAEELVEALEAALAPSGRAAAGPPTPPTRRIAGPASGAAPVPPARRSRRSPAAFALIALAGALLLAAGAAALLGGGDGGGGAARADRPQQPREQREPERTAAPEETATEEPKAEPTAEATASPAPEETTAPEGDGRGEPDLARARALQLQGFNARNDEDYNRAIDLSRQALEACAGARELNPCGYALFELGASLNRSGRPDEAIPFLRQRLEYGDNAQGEVARELRAAEKAARKDG